MLNYFFQYKFSILVAGFIVLLSLIPNDRMPESSLFDIGYLDKIVHFGMYSFLGFVTLLENRCHDQCRRQHLILLLSVFSLSAVIEILQATVVSSRSAEWKDLLANLSGLLAGYAAYRIIRQVRS